VCGDSAGRDGLSDIHVVFHRLDWRIAAGKLFEGALTRRDGCAS
jgi:hypothetical protein